MSAPLARSDDLFVEHVGDEVLIYDQLTDQAHCLSSPAGRVWRACDGKTSVGRLMDELALDKPTVELALDELDHCGLLDTGPADSGITRRQAASRFAKMGAAAAAAPLIYSIVAPTPALAASQAFCLGVISCSGNCNDCFTVHCCCCHANPSSNKLCTADCSATNCNVAALASCGATALGNCNCG